MYIKWCWSFVWCRGGSGSGEIPVPVISRKCILIRVQRLRPAVKPQDVKKKEKQYVKPERVTELLLSGKQLLRLRDGELFYAVLNTLRLSDEVPTRVLDELVKAFRETSTEEIKSSNEAWLSRFVAFYRALDKECPEWRKLSPNARWIFKMIIRSLDGENVTLKWLNSVWIDLQEVKLASDGAEFRKAHRLTPMPGGTCARAVTEHDRVLLEREREEARRGLYFRKWLEERRPLIDWSRQYPQSMYDAELLENPKLPDYRTWMAASIKRIDPKSKARFEKWYDYNYSALEVALARLRDVERHDAIVVLLEEDRKRRVLVDAERGKSHKRMLTKKAMQVEKGRVRQEDAVFAAHGAEESDFAPAAAHTPSPQAKPSGGGVLKHYIKVVKALTERDITVEIVREEAPECRELSLYVQGGQIAELPKTMVINSMIMSAVQDRVSGLFPELAETFRTRVAQVRKMKVEAYANMSKLKRQKASINSELRVEAEEELHTRTRRAMEDAPDQALFHKNVDPIFRARVEKEREFAEASMELADDVRRFIAQMNRPQIEDVRPIEDIFNQSRPVKDDRKLHSRNKPGKHRPVINPLAAFTTAMLLIAALIAPASAFIFRASPVNDTHFAFCWMEIPGEEMCAVEGKWICDLSVKPVDVPWNRFDEYIRSAELLLSNFRMKLEEFWACPSCLMGDSLRDFLDDLRELVHWHTCDWIPDIYWYEVINEMQERSLPYLRMFCDTWDHFDRMTEGAREEARKAYESAKVTANLVFEKSKQVAEELSHEARHRAQRVAEVAKDVRDNIGRSAVKAVDNLFERWRKYRQGDHAVQPSRDEGMCSDREEAHIEYRAQLKADKMLADHLKRLESQLNGNNGEWTNGDDMPVNDTRFGVRRQPVNRVAANQHAIDRSRRAMAPAAVRANVQAHILDQAAVRRANGGDPALVDELEGLNYTPENATRIARMYFNMDADVLHYNDFRARINPTRHRVRETGGSLLDFENNRRLVQRLFDDIRRGLVERPSLRTEDEYSEAETEAAEREPAPPEQLFAQIAPLLQFDEDEAEGIPPEPQIRRHADEQRALGPFDPVHGGAPFVFPQPLVGRRWNPEVRVRDDLDAIDPDAYIDEHTLGVVVPPPPAPLMGNAIPQLLAAVGAAAAPPPLPPPQPAPAPAPIAAMVPAPPAPVLPPQAPAPALPQNGAPPPPPQVPQPPQPVAPAPAPPAPAPQANPAGPQAQAQPAPGPAAQQAPVVQGPRPAYETEDMYVTTDFSGWKVVPQRRVEHGMVKVLRENRGIQIQVGNFGRVKFCPYELMRMLFLVSCLIPSTSLVFSMAALDTLFEYFNPRQCMFAYVMLIVCQIESFFPKLKLLRVFATLIFFGIRGYRPLYYTYYHFVEQEEILRDNRAYWCKKEKLLNQARMGVYTCRRAWRFAGLCSVIFEVAEGYVEMEACIARVTTITSCEASHLRTAVATTVSKVGNDTGVALRGEDRELIPGVHHLAKCLIMRQAMTLHDEENASPLWN